MMCFDILSPSLIPSPWNSEEFDDRDEAHAVSSVARGMLTIHEISERFDGFLVAFKEYLHISGRPEDALSPAQLLETTTRCFQTASSFHPILELTVRPRSQHRCVASPSYYHRSRYDYVQIDGQPQGGEKTKWYGQLCAIFKYTAIGYNQIERLALVKQFDTIEKRHRLFEVPVVREGSRLQLVHIDTVDQRVLLKPDFRDTTRFFVHT
jgi:hypothetical protein